MGFLDKAKQAAEQAQKKLEETQSNFNKGQAEKAQQGSGVQYDKHGRPIQPDEPPAAAAPAPSGQPPAGAPSVPPSPAGSPMPEPPPPAAGAVPPESAPPAAGPAVGEPGTVPPPPADPAAPPAEPQQDEPLREGINQNPDPFRPIE